MIAEFMDLQEIPRGPILLRDWDIGLGALGASRHFDHRVFALPRLSRTATLRWLRARSIGYAYVQRGTAQDAWVRAEPQVRTLFADRRVAAYALP